MKFSIFVFLVAPLFNASAFAKTFSHSTDPYFEIVSNETTIIQQSDQEMSDEDFAIEMATQPEAIQGAEGLDPMAIAELVFKVWDIIKEGKPVVNVDLKDAKALPNAAEYQWTKLTGWQRERTTKFRYSVKNAFGMETITFVYSLKLIYGGGMKGMGRYIASARIRPELLNVLWGYNFDAQVTVPAVTNMGTEEDPLAAIYLDLGYRTHTLIKSSNGGESFLVQGDGLMMSTTSKQIFFEAVDRDKMLPSVKPLH
jgi:hypothetical protein